MMGRRMSKPVLLAHDNLDDRREIHRLLARLSPAGRVDFLRKACAAATLPAAKTHPGVSQKTLALAGLAQRDDSADARLTLDVYMDLWYLSAHYRFDLDRALAQLVQLVRGRRQSR